MDEQPPSRPPRPRPQPPTRRRAAAARSSRAAASREAPPRRRQRPPAPPSRRPPVDHEGEGEGPARQPRSQAKLVVLLSVLTVLVISLAGFGMSLASRSSDDAPAPADPDTPVPVTRFEDPETGASLEYPRSWRRVEVPNATYRLVLDGGNDLAMTLRVFPTEVPTTAENLANIKAVTDGIVTSNPTVQILKQQAITLNGMVGYYYFYTFNDNNGLQAVHAHYFLFQGHKMNMIVFQALADDFEKNAATFDRIAESFHSDPRVTIPPATTAPSTTTAPTTPGG
ncbi:MAG TPA: hypothetical protein VHF27_13535 [Acidimicrobiales bacterium]|nr:hypothetical protein [Acidimicrobiales bacterium]